MEQDAMLQENVLAELRSDPRVDASRIGVTAADGIVTLTGTVASYGEKWAAERAAKRVYGVRGLAEELQAAVPPDDERTDANIVKAALHVLKWHTAVPDDRIQVTVAKGALRLEGTVDWPYQKEVAEGAVRFLLGVKSVDNRIEVAPPAPVSPHEVRMQIEDALRRNAELDARRIDVRCRDGTVSLHGNVRSWPEREEAARAAANAPGVREVQNELAITP